MLSSQAEEYTVTPDRRGKGPGAVRSGLRGFVREVQRRSLRKKKLCTNNQDYTSEGCSLKNEGHFMDLDQNRNNSMISNLYSPGKNFKLV